MYELIDEIKENSSKQTLDEIKDCIFDAASSNKSGWKGLFTWLDDYDGLVGQAIKEVYFESQFEVMKTRVINSNNYSTFLNSISILAYQYFIRFDMSVDIAYKVLGKEMFLEMEQAMFNELQAIMHSTSTWKGEEWIDQSSLIIQFRRMYEEETASSRYHQRIMDTFDKATIEIQEPQKTL